MDFLERFKLKVKRGETPFFRALCAIAKSLLRANVPTPAIVRPLLRLLYEFHFFAIVAFRWVRSVFYWTPLFRSRCASVGRNLRLEAMPYVNGHVELHLGDDVVFGGKVDILSARFLNQPRLIMKDRSAVGANSLISVSREVVIEEDVIISVNCRISDSDGHPRDAELRARHAPLSPRDIRPVRICRNAWIGNGCQIMKGVTIGEGAIVGADSVVISDIPAYCLAMGNPAEVYFRNIGKPRNRGGATQASAGH
jgi:acetyltransferase-like isoleucine patch superfamily enzyme